MKKKVGKVQIFKTMRQIRYWKLKAWIARIVTTTLNNRKKLKRERQKEPFMMQISEIINYIFK